MIGTFAALGSPLTVEICGRAGFDWVLLDLEHGAGNEYLLLHQLQALGGTTAEGIVRVAANSRVDVTKALDRGAAGVMVPRVESLADAQSAARHVQYPPEGDRGVALMNRGAGFGRLSVTELLLQRPLLVVQIETAPALANLSPIAATPGIDVLFVGPSDLTWSLGIPGQVDDKRYRAAVAEVAKVAREHGKAAGVLLGSAEMAPPYIELGYTFIGISADAGFLQAAARSGLARARDLAKLSSD
jgi:2-keto-3-deoxy-L-rhamnonate aldolase RhmA